MQLTGQAAVAAAPTATTEAAVSSSESKTPRQQAATMEYGPASEVTCLD